MLRFLRACGLIIAFSIVVVLGATAYILYSSFPGASLESILSTLTRIETGQIEVNNGSKVPRETRTPVNTAKPQSQSATPLSGRIFASYTPIKPADSAIPPTTTLVPLTAISIPSTATALPASSTPIPSTNTRIPPTATPMPRTATSVPATKTPVLLSATPITPTETRVPPSATLIPTSTKPYSVTLFSSPLRKYVRGPVNLRRGPGTSYDKIGLVDAGTHIDVIGQSGDWYVIMHNLTEAFIASWLTYEVATSTPTRAPTATRVPATTQVIPLTKYAQSLRRFTPGAVNLRQGPGTAYDKVGSVLAGTTLHIYGQSGDWYLIKHNGRDAYIASWLTIDVPSATSVRRSTSVRSSTAIPRIEVQRFSAPRQKYVHGTVNLRRGPGTTYAIVGSLPAGATLQALGQSGDWYLLRHNGRDAYVANWLTHNSPPSPPSSRSASSSSSSAANSQPAQQPQPAYSCSPRKNCGQMSSCAEARFHLRQCGRGSLDRDKDGVPCESICPGG